MTASTTGRIAALGLVALLGLAACSQNAERTSSTSGSTPSATSVTPVSVVAVELGRGVDAEKKITDRVEVFRPNDTIYASVLTNGASPHSTLGVKWTYQDGQIVDQSEQTIQSDGAAATEFHIAKPDGFPSGEYKVEVSVDGTPVKSKDFKVTAS